MPDEERIRHEGLILFVKELHDRLERLVALNAERANEEAEGHVRWLQPDYQIPRFAQSATTKTSELDLGEDRGVRPVPPGLPERPL
jgi:hypothetical protein